MKKKCTKCGIEKELNEFNRCSKNRSGLKEKCRSCQSKEEKERYRNNPKKKAEYYSNNVEKIKKYRKENSEKLKVSSRSYCIKNRKRLSDRMNEYRKKNPGVYMYMRDHRYLYSYGITLDQKNEIAKNQGYRCLICGIDFKSIPERHVHVDHDHTTGVIRGLLCHWCNSGLGLFKENTDILQKATEYLSNRNTGILQPLKEEQKA